MFELDTYGKLNEKLQGAGVDVIFERLLGGIDLIPREPHLIGAVLQRWYKLLNKGGVLFAQVPNEFSNFVYALRLKLRSENVKGVQINTALNEELAKFSSYALHLRKLHDAPDELPLLDSRMVTAISQSKKSKQQ